MPKISAATSTTPPLATDMLPFARSGDTVARHITVGNLRGGVYNVKDYGAVGDGVTNDTAAIQAAINAAAAISGGTVYFPVPANGYYKITSALVVKNAVNLHGSGGGYGGATCKIAQATAGAHVFSVAENVRDMEFRDLYIVTTAALGAVLAGSHGIHFEGSSAVGPSGQIGIANCYFRGLEWGIYVLATDVSHNWQIDDVQLDRCTFAECTNDIYLDSANANFWQFNSCRFSTTGAGSDRCIEILRGGALTFINCTGSGNAASTIFINVIGVCNGIVFVNCQAEAVLETLDVQAAATSNWAAYVFQGCTIDAPIYFRQTCQATFIGTIFNESVFAPATDVKIYAIGCMFASGKSLLPSGTGFASMVVFNATLANVSVAGDIYASLGFYGTTPIAKQTGVAVSTAAIHAALVALGLIAA